MENMAILKAYSETNEDIRKCDEDVKKLISDSIRLLEQQLFIEVSKIFDSAETGKHQNVSLNRLRILLENEEECIDLQTELIDRFGTIPQSVRNLMEISLIRNVACSLGIRKVSTTPTGILFFPENPDATKVTRLARMSGMNGKILYNAGKIPYFCYKMNTKEGKILQNVENILALYTEISQNGIDKEQK
jgi:transcription-repair coupling factor (superfamily II helicase)